MVQVYGVELDYKRTFLELFLWFVEFTILSRDQTLSLWLCTFENLNLNYDWCGVSQCIQKLASKSKTSVQWSFQKSEQRNLMPAIGLKRGRQSLLLEKTHKPSFWKVNLNHVEQRNVLFHPFRSPLGIWRSQILPAMAAASRIRYRTKTGSFFGKLPLWSGLEKFCFTVIGEFARNRSSRSPLVFSSRDWLSNVIHYSQQGEIWY